MNSESNRDLIRRFYMCENSCFDEYAARVWQTLVQNLKRKGAQEQDAEDAAQVALFRGFLTKKVDPEKFEYWLRRVAHRCWLDHLRQVQRRGEWPLEEDLPEEDADGDMVDRKGRCREKWIEWRRRWIERYAASEPFLTIVVLFYSESLIRVTTLTKTRLAAYFATTTKKVEQGWAKAEPMLRALEPPA